MATIRARKQADGTKRYCAIVRIRRKGIVLLHETKTFSHDSAADSWARRREVELESPAELARVQQVSHSLGGLIRWYMDTFQTISKWQRSKQTHLEFLERHTISDFGALELTTEILLDHVRRRRANGTGPATVGGAQAIATLRIGLGQRDRDPFFDQHFFQSMTHLWRPGSQAAMHELPDCPAMNP